jgi:hypothetical protein
MGIGMRNRRGILITDGNLKAAEWGIGHYHEPVGQVTAVSLGSVPRGKVTVPLACPHCPSDLSPSCMERGQVNEKGTDLHGAKIRLFWVSTSFGKVIPKARRFFWRHH